MKARVSILVMSIGMMACGTQPPSQSLPAAAPPVQTLVSLPLQPEQEYPPGHGFSFCKLGSDCEALDPRPFEACLLATNRCSDKIVEPLLVDESEPVR